MPVGDARGQWVRHTLDSTSRGANGVRVSDVNQDGVAELLVTCEQAFGAKSGGFLHASMRHCHGFSAC